MDRMEFLLLDGPASAHAGLARALLQAAERGIRLSRVADAGALAARMTDAPADVIVLDGARLEPAPHADVIRIVRAAGGRPVLVLAASDDPAAEQALLGAGVHEVVPLEHADVRLLERVARYGAAARRAFETMTASERRYRDFFMNDLTGDFVTTPGGQIIDVNPRFVRMFGFDSREHVLRTNPNTMYASEGARAELMEQVKKHRRLDQIELELRRLDGTPIHAIENLVGDFDEHGRLVTVYGYLFDITERVRLERQLLQAQKMEAIGRLAGGVAHDFNNLLTVILGQAQWLAGAPELCPEARQSVRDIISAADRAASLTRQLLAFSREQVLEARVIDLNDLIRRATGVLGRLLPEGVRLDIALDEALWPIAVDPGQMEQVLLNLVVNARDAMPGGGTVTIRSCNVDTSAGERVRLSVSDTGVGISEADVQRVFEPFFTTKEAGKGTGLGLSVAYSIVRQAGGTITPYSEEGHGALFEVDLPRRGRPPLAAPAHGEAPSRGRPGTILLVEDEPAVRRLAEDMLRREGYHVIAATSGSEALDRLEEHAEVSLLLTDVVMPGMNGLDLARHARALRPGLRVVFMTGYGEGAAEEAGLSGAGLIAKPFTPAALARKIHETLSDG
jgi:PAS domain S-box-containing protein